MDSGILREFRSKSSFAITPPCTIRRKILNGRRQKTRPLRLWGARGNRTAFGSRIGGEIRVVFIVIRGLEGIFFHHFGRRRAPWPKQIRADKTAALRFLRK